MNVKPPTAIALLLCASIALHADSTPGRGSKESAVNAEKEPRYLAFQIFTYYSPNPKEAQLLSSGSSEQLSPGNAALSNSATTRRSRI